MGGHKRISALQIILAEKTFHSQGAWIKPLYKATVKYDFHFYCLNIKILALFWISTLQLTVYHRLIYSSIVTIRYFKEI